MIRMSKAPVPFPIPWNTSLVFMLRAGDVIERGEFEADLAGLGAGRVYEFQLNEAFDQGAAVLLGEGEELEHLREIVAAEADGSDLTAEAQAGLSAAREAVRQAWPAYSALISQQARRNELIPTLAFQRFCTGWEGAGLPEYGKGPDGKLRLDVVGNIEPIVIRMAGMEAYRMLYATGEEKNSVPPLPSDKSPARSTSGKSTKAGTSGKKSGPKTRSSPSRKASSRSSTSGSTAGQDEA